jgi:hypothetical protein
MREEGAGRLVEGEPDRAVEGLVFGEAGEGHEAAMLGSSHARQ